MLELEDDEIAGIRHPNDGNRAMSLSIGPLVSYDFFWEDRPWTVTLKTLFGVTGENSARANGFVLRLGTKLF
jgi:hypothetical protein